MSKFVNKSQAYKNIFSIIHKKHFSRFSDIVDYCLKNDFYLFQVLCDDVNCVVADYFKTLK